MQYERIMYSWNLEEAAHRYLAYKFGSSIPVNFKPLIEHVLRSIFAERSEAEFIRDAHTMYAVRQIR